MAILEALCTIVNAIICCTLLEKREEHVERIHIVQNEHMDVKQDEDQENTISNSTLINQTDPKHPYTLNKVYEEELGESSEKRQQQQNSEKNIGKLILITEEHWNKFLSYLENYNVSGEVTFNCKEESRFKPRLFVMNPATNGSTDILTTFTSYIPYNMEIQDVNKSTYPLTSTKNSRYKSRLSFKKLRRCTAAVFHRCFQTLINKMNYNYFFK